jgi:hypothetical protein
MENSKSMSSRFSCDRCNDVEANKLMDFVQETVKENQNIQEHRKTITDKNTTVRKLLVWGLNLETNSGSQLLGNEITHALLALEKNEIVFTSFVNVPLVIAYGTSLT